MSLQPITEALDVMAGAHIPSVRFYAWMCAWVGPSWMETRSPTYLASDQSDGNGDGNNLEGPPAKARSSRYAPFLLSFPQNLASKNMYCNICTSEGAKI